MIESSLGPDEAPPSSEPGLDTAWLNAHGIALPPAELDAARRFGDHELLGEVGRGGMGVIFKARHLRLDRVVALKMVLAGPIASPDFIRRFQIEARAAAGLDHPHIVPIYEVGEIEGQQYYTMRLVDGPNLAQHLKRSGAPEPRRAAEWMAVVARAVHYAHQRGVLHRDLKPANILLDADGQPHVSDFGLAKLMAEESGVTLSQAALGTPNYMSPEQATGKVKDLTVAADVYSLGAILWEALTGRRVFEGASPLATISQVLDNDPPPPSLLNPAVPRDLDTICLKCLRKEAGRRYESALDLAEDLEHWAAGEPIRARRVGLPERAWLWCRRRPAIAGLALVSVAALLAVSALALWRVRTARQKEDLERYAANISLADSAVRAGSMDRALEYLTKCPDRLRHWEWGRLLFECFQEVSSIPAHTDRPRFLTRPLVEEVAFNEQGDHIATRGKDGDLAVWDPIEGRALFRVGDSTNRITAFSFRPEHPQIAIGRLDGSVEIIDNDSGRLVISVIPASPQPSDAAVDPVVWLNYDAYDRSPIRDLLRRRPDAVTRLSWDPSGRRLAVVRAGGRVIVRDPQDVRRQWEWAPPDLAEPVTAWFTPDGSAVVVQGTGQALRLDVVTGEEVGALRWATSSNAPVAVWLASAVVSPTGTRVVLIDRQNRATLRGDAGLVAGLGTLVQRNANAPLTSFFSQNGEVFCTSGDVGTARVFRSETGELLFALPDTVYGGAFSAKGDLVAAYGEERGVHLWDVHHRLKLHTLHGHLSSIVAVAFEPHERLVATASREGVVKTWGALRSGQALLADTVSPSSGYSPDGRWLAVAPSFRGIRLWEADTGRLRWTVPSRTQNGNMLSFSPDGRRLYVAGSDRCVRILNVPDGTSAGMLRGHNRPAFVVHCSPDGRYVATGDHGGVVKIWEAATGVELRSFAAHRAIVVSLQFDTTSRFLVSAGTERPRLWDVASGRLVVELDEDGSGAMYATFAPGGRQVAAACLDNRIRVWDVPSGRLAAKWNNQTQGTSYWDYSPDGLRFAVPVADMGTLGISVPKLEIWDAEHGRALLSLDAHRESIYAVAFDPSRRRRRIVTSSMDTTVRQWEAFPWLDEDYPEPRGKSLIERVRHYARDYWRERLRRVADAPPMPRMSEEPPLPPGIPEWERDRWPKRDPLAGLLQVNLDAYYTGVLDACIYPNWNELEYDDDLSELPSGLQRFGGVLLDVRGVVWLRPRLPNPSDHTFRGSCHDFPERVEGIAIGRKFQQFHVLHAATTYNAGDTGFLKGPGGKPLAVAAYVLRYADGTRHEHEVVYGRDLRNWWRGGRGDAEAGVERAIVAWTGSNAVTERYEAELRLFLSTFENPRPDVEVVGIDFVSKQTLAAPFLVAMTVEP